MEVFQVFIVLPRMRRMDLSTPVAMTIWERVLTPWITISLLGPLILPQLVVMQTLLGVHLLSPTADLALGPTVDQAPVRKCKRLLLVVPL